MRLSTSLLLLLCLSSAVLVKAQSPYQLQWSLSEPSGITPSLIDCINPYDTECQKVRIDHDNNVIVAGTSKENGGFDLLVAKYTSDGSVLWKQLIDVLPDSKDYLVDIILDEFGALYLLIYSQVPEAGIQTRLLKLNGQGELIWETQLLEGYIQSIARDMVQASDQSIYITGFTSYFNENGQFNCKVTADGQLEWMHVDDFEPYVQARGIHVYLLEDNIVFLGAGGSELLKVYSPEGDIISTYPNNSAQIGVVIRNDGEGNILMGSGSDFKIAKYNQQGIPMWEFELPDDLPEHVTANRISDIVLDEAGNAYATGYFFDGNNTGDLVVVKISTTGELLYSYYYQGQGMEISETGTRLSLGPANYLAVGGYTLLEGGVDTDYVAVVLDADGVAVDTINYESVGRDFVKSVRLDEELNLYLTGTQNGNTLTQKYNFNGTVRTSSVQDYPEVVIAPNPAHQKITVQSTSVNGAYELQIFDLTGRVVHQQRGEFLVNAEIDISSLTNGIFFVQLQVQDRQITKKIVKN